MPLVNENIRILRKKMGLTQEKFAGLLGIKRSLVGAYEEGRAVPPTENLYKLSKVFGISLEQLLNHSFYKDAGFQLTIENKQQTAPQSPDNTFYPDLFSPATHAEAIKKEDLKNKHIQELAQSLDPASFKYVSAASSAQYIRQFNDPVFLLNLPSFQFPGLPKGEYRAFEAQNDFTLPGSVIVGTHIKNLTSLENGKNYLLVTKNQGVIYRRVYNQMEWKGNLLLSADIHGIPSSEIYPNEILEVWEAVAYMSYTMPKPGISLENLENIIGELNAEIKRLRP